MKTHALFCSLFACARWLVHAAQLRTRDAKARRSSIRMMDRSGRFTHGSVPAAAHIRHLCFTAARGFLFAAFSGGRCHCGHRSLRAAHNIRIWRRTYTVTCRGCLILQALLAAFYAAAMVSSLLLTRGVVTLHTHCLLHLPACPF